MSRPDVLTELRSARPTAPAELRERVRLIAAAEERPPRRVSWKFGIVAFAVVGAVAAAVVATRGNDRPATERGAVHGAALSDSAAPQTKLAPRAVRVIPAPSSTRLQRYRAYIELRVASANDVSRVTQRAITIARSLGGYVLGANVNARGRSGTADLRLRVPRQNVQEAVARLSQLGAILAEDVNVQDLQAQVSGSDRLVERLQTRLRALRAQEQTDTVKKQIEALTTRIQQLQRSRATTVREARYATVQLELTTHKPAAATPPRADGDGPLHGLGVAFRWIGIGAVYAVALGAPFALLALLVWLAARAVRRRREESLLSAP
jgi:hypothetical protein